MKIKYPVYVPYLKGNEQKYVHECLTSTWISSKGSFIPKFEKSFAEFTGSKYATVVSNGTVAIHDALVALGIKPGDEVIVPTFTYIASVNPVRYVGATPVFVDSRPDTWQLDPDEISKKVTARTKAIIAVHLYGYSCDMESIVGIAKEHNLRVVEDCAEAFGTEYKGKHVGTFGDIATFSFFGNKTITTGEGGMVVTNDPTLFKRAVHYKGQAVDDHREYWHDDIGYNYRMTNVCAAIGLAQMEQARDIIRKKTEIARWYRTYLKDLNLTMPPEDPDIFNTYWLFTIMVKHPGERDLLRKFLSERGIETRPTFHPAHTMPMYLGNDKYPVAESLSRRGINLPSYPALTKKDVYYIAQNIIDFYENSH